MNTKQSSCRRALSALLSLLVAVGPAMPAYGAVTPLADEPIAAKPTAPPNIMLTVDDSTSMLSDFLPDYVIGKPPGAEALSAGFCRQPDGLMNAACGFDGTATTPQYIYSQANVPFPTYATGNPPNAFSYTASTVPDALRLWPAPVHNAALNRIYYDPAIDYDPPLKYDGTPYPEQTTFTAVPADPWISPVRNVNLTSAVSVGLYCNTDWPLSIDPRPTAVNGGVSCRINGTDYSSVVPAAVDDYQYPLGKTSLPVGVLLPTDPTHKRFYSRLGGTYTLWCDKGAANWPQTCTTTGYSCPVGQTYIPPTSQPQTCKFASNTTGCLSSTTTYTPAGCNTNPLYGSPGPCTGAECLPCSSSTTCTLTGVNGKTGNCRLTATMTGGSGAACSCSGATCTLPACPAYTVGGVGTCSGGATPTPVTSCTPAASANCTTMTVDSVTKLPTTTTMLADANGAGTVCRHNNQAYPDGTTANPFNYSASHAKYKTAVTGSCATFPNSYSTVRHYWKTSVEWCAARITTTDDKWRGYGKPGTCQDEHDSAHPYPRFYKYGVRKTDPQYADNYTYSAMERVDLSSSLTNCSAQSKAIDASKYCVHQFYDRKGALKTVKRTYAEEMQNYANWFAYYRTRLQAAKTVVSQNFKFLDDAYRVGFHTLNNNPSSTFVDINKFDAAQKNTWYSKLFVVQPPMGQQTPTLDAVTRVGEHFKNGSHPSLPGSTDPIKLSCMKNYHMLFTDGILKQAALPATPLVPADQDDIVPALPVAVTGLTTGAPWPPLYREDPAAKKANTLADYAMSYWVNDMRPAMPNDVPAGKDVATWQHLNFAALSLGTEGVLQSTSVAATEAAIAAGTTLWPTPAAGHPWAPGAAGVDDLWHAAVNGRGRFVNAKTSSQMGRGIAAILADIDSPSGGRSGAAIGSPNIRSGDFTYVAGFVTGWGGELKKFALDPGTAVPTGGWLWDAATAMTTQTTPTIPVPDPWYVNRHIFTLDASGAAVPFRQASLTPSQALTLGPDTATQTDVVEYLRGKRSNEGDDEGQFRSRASPLGDIVDSSPTIVGAPPWQYDDATDPGYSAFKATHGSRAKRIYVGANDGMLHAIDDADGHEAWAFVPPDFYRADDKSGLIGLTYQPGGLPLYAHRYYVNATPRIVDADVGNDGTSWRSMLVTGLGKGGKSYYALNVSDPAAVTSDATAASQFMWKFDASSIPDGDLGYTYGQAMIVKTRAYGWVVIVPTGYNNPTGVGKIYIIRASDGVRLETLSTGFGSPGSPSGLAHISGFTRDLRDQTVEQIYGGDLYGNLWRFDVSSASVSDWKVEKLAYLEAGGVGQPITTPPDIEVDIANGVDRWVLIGTGRLLENSDLADTQQQTMYAIRDGTSAAPWPITAAVTRAVLDSVSGSAGLGKGVVAEKGWYDDLPADERIITPVRAEVGIAAYVSTELPDDPCDIGMPANVYVRAYGNGESLLSTGEYVHSATGAVSIDIVAVPKPGCPTCNPEIKLIVTTGGASGDADKVISVPARLPGVTGQNRVNWRSISN